MPVIIIIDLKLTILSILNLYKLLSISHQHIIIILLKDEGVKYN